MTIHFHPKMTQGQAKALAMRLGARTALQNGRTVLLYEPHLQPKSRFILFGGTPSVKGVSTIEHDHPQPPSAA